MEKTKTHRDMLEDEWYHVRHSGEIPEIALHSSIHYLTEDSEGPKITLDADDYSILSSAALERYREIIIRDITPENRDTTMYRGILRTIANWRRLKRFCLRHNLNSDSVKVQLCRLLPAFLENEIADVTLNSRSSSINCTFDDINSFALELGISLTDQEKELRKICMDF